MTRATLKTRNRRLLSSNKSLQTYGANRIDKNASEKVFGLGNLNILPAVRRFRRLCRRLLLETKNSTLRRLVSAAMEAANRRAQNATALIDGRHANRMRPKCRCAFAAPMKIVVQRSARVSIERDGARNTPIRSKRLKKRSNRRRAW